uniref:MHC class I-like antigen recognition-like domain-containing protein n=1 Tax=Vombatus ursinus TaxID=29139 RepID=A0A4X2K1J4_VOMUR
MEPYLHSLVMLGTLALTGTCAGSHSLRYFSAAVASPELAEPRFLSVGYVDDQLFVRFDSARASPRMEPRAAWMERMDREEPGYWERSTRRSEANAQVSRAGLRHLRRYFNQSEAGVHILQAMSCCEVSPELTFRRGFLQFAYDGRDYPALDTETSTWTAAVPQAVNSKRKWEAERSISEGDKAYLEETSVLWLKKYLEMGKETLQRAEPEPFSPWFIVGVIAVLLLLITVIARVVIWRKKKSGGQDCEGALREQAPWRSWLPLTRSLSFCPHILSFPSKGLSDGP